MRICNTDSADARVGFLILCCMHGSREMDINKNGLASHRGHGELYGKYGGHRHAFGDKGNDSVWSYPVIGGYWRCKKVPAYPLRFQQHRENVRMHFLQQNAAWRSEGVS